MKKRLVLKVPVVVDWNSKKQVCTIEYGEVSPIKIGNAEVHINFPESVEYPAS